MAGVDLRQAQLGENEHICSGFFVPKSVIWNAQSGGITYFALL
jgi:hypothetical protein